MPRRTKNSAAADKAAQPRLSAELLEQRIPRPVTPAELEGIFQPFKKSVHERALGAEKGATRPARPSPKAPPQAIATARAPRRC